MRQIRGKTALVTGAAGGIGRALALRLADEGARVCLLDVNVGGLFQLAAEVRRRGAHALIRSCDLTSLDEINASVAYLRDEWGGLDILVNNAGITYYGRMHLMAPEHIDRLLAVNVRAPMELSRAVLPILEDRGGGHIVNMASVFGLVGMPRIAAYSAAKFALVGFGDAIRAEYVRSNIGVTTVCPGFVDTELFENAPRGDDRPTAMHPPRWLMTTPDRVAERTIRAIKRNEATVVMQPYVRAAWWGKRLVPWLYDWAHGVRLRRRKSPQTQPSTESTHERRAA